MELKPTGAEYYLRQIFPISRKGAFKGGPESNGSFRTLRGDEVPLDHSIWHRAIRSIQNDETIADYEDLLLDARYHTAKTEIRRAIIDLAVACEQACEATFVQIVRERNMSSFRRGRYYTGNDLTKHLNQDLQKLSGFSLSKDAPDINASISELWNLRGDLAHGRKQTLTTEKVDALIQATEACVRWLEKLPAGRTAGHE